MSKWIFTRGDMLGIALMMLAFGIYMGGMIDEKFVRGPDIKELGQAICEEEYDMDYVNYNTGNGLVCKPKVVKDRYDGINIKLEVGKDEAKS